MHDNDKAGHSFPGPDARSGASFIPHLWRSAGHTEVNSKIHPDLISLHFHLLESYHSLLSEMLIGENFFEGKIMTFIQI